MTYLVSLKSAKFPVLDPKSKSAWDSGGGAPDPKLCVGVDGKSLFCTKAAQDVFQATFSESFSVKLFQSSELDVWAYDEDVFSDDLADGSAWSTTGLLGLIKAGAKSGFLFNDVVEVEFTIAPTF